MTDCVAVSQNALNQRLTLPGSRQLDAVQRSVIDDVLLHKRNVFLTGSGGVGKSFVTKLLIDLLKEHYGYVCLSPD